MAFTTVMSMILARDDDNTDTIAMVLDLKSSLILFPVKLETAITPANVLRTAMKLYKGPVGRGPVANARTKMKTMNATDSARLMP